MLQAAAQRLSRTSLSQPPQDPASSLSLSPSPSRPSAEQRSPRSTRRLSKISATEFDSVLSAGETVRIKSREPELGDPAAEQTAFDATTASPARQGSSRDLVNAGFAHEGNSAIVERVPQPELALNGGGIGRTGPDGDSFGSTDPAGTSPAFNTAPATSGSSDVTHYDSLVAVGAIDPIPTPRSRRNSTAPPADAAIPVTFPSPGRSTEARPPPMMHSNSSNSTLATAFGLSPRRRRVQSDETVQDRSFAGTMRKTSRFFRKFGGNSDPDHSRAISATASSAPSKSSANPGRHLAPPVPAAPPPYTETTGLAVPARPVTPPARQPIAARLPRTPPGRSPKRNATSSGATVPLIFPSPEKPGRRRRSVSMSSLERRESRTTSSTSGDSPVSTRSRPGRSEDERLKRELRKWKIAIEGVMDDDVLISSEAEAATDSGTGDVSATRAGAGLLSPAFETESSTTAEISRPSGSSATASTSRADTPEIRLHSPSANPGPPLNSDSLPDPRQTSPMRPAEPGLAIIDTTPIRTQRNDSIPSDGQDSPSDLSLREFLARAERSPPTQVATLAKAPATHDASSPHPDDHVHGEREVLLTSAGRESPLPYTPRPQSRAAKTAAGRQNFDDLDESAMDTKAQEIAQQIFEGDESFIDSRKAAKWLGSSSRISAAALRHYLQKFDFAGLRLDGAFRRLCNKLYLKAETQQVDRILEQFSLRYFQENPQTPFASPDIVHAVSYSVLLLNTDLHIVDSTTRMTRQQFVRNTLEAIKAQAELDETAMPPALLFSSPKAEGYPKMLADETASVFGSPQASASRITVDSISAAPPAPAQRPDGDSPSDSLAHLPASPAMSRTATTLSARGTDSPAPPPVRSESVMSLNSTFSHRSLEVSLQSILKDIYAAVKSHPIYQTSTGSASTLGLPEAGRSSISLNPAASPYATWSPHLQRRASHRSTNSTVSGMGARLNSHKRASVRGLGALIGASSLDLVRSTSPTPSTATSLSDEHWGFAQGASMLHQGPTNSIGFASNLAHTIIKEQHEDDARSEASLVEITDEELALLGAPWAKEGLLERKHYWEAAGKRSKEKSWLKAFVVVSAGELRMFRFGAENGGGGPGSQGALGGGDWSTNASNLGALSLVHALASTVPPPGYNRSRPHCFIFTLPDGGSFFFQAGTPDLVAEWVSTCNYWSARLSREPLAGGVSNMEYGWNRVDASDTGAEIASIRSGHSRRSFASAAFRHGAPLTEGDRLHINDWTPPQTPLAPSQLAEDAQLDALKRHLAVLQKEIRDHEALKSLMTRLYSPRSSNATKALANWTRKAQHLQSERVKYSTYIETLSSAIKLRALHNGKKEVEHMLATADAAGADEDELVSSPRSSGTIDPHATPIAPTSFLPSQSVAPMTAEAAEPAAGSHPTSGSQQSSTADCFESRTDTPSPA